MIADAWAIYFSVFAMLCVFPVGLDKMDLFSSQDKCLCPRLRVWDAELLV